jgi:hypothetical protein
VAKNDKKQRSIPGIYYPYAWFPNVQTGEFFRTRASQFLEKC